MRAAKPFPSAQSSPAKRPTAFVNVQRSPQMLNVKYNGLSANKSLEARRIEMMGEAGQSCSSKSKTESQERVQKAECSGTFLPQINSKQAEGSSESKSNGKSNSKDKNFESSVQNSEPHTKSEGVELSTKATHVDSDDEEKNRDATTEKKSVDGKEEDEAEEKKISKKLNPEEVAEKFEAGLKKCQAKCQLLLSTNPRDLDQEGAPYNNDFRQCVLVFAKSYFYFKSSEVPWTEIVRYRNAIGELLSEEHVLKILLDVLVDGLKRKDFVAEDGQLIKEFWFPVKNILMTLLNYSDRVDKVKFVITQYEQCLPMFIEVLESYYSSHMEKSLKPEQEKLVSWCLSILHNCGSLEENIPTIRDLNAIPVLLKYLDSPDVAIRLCSISTLADLVNESEAELLGTHPHIFSFVIRKLERALKTESHRDVGWSVEELIRAVRQLARNDVNKAVLVEKGCLPQLHKALRKGNSDEIQEALGCLWYLSFDSKNKRKILEEPGLVASIKDKYNTLEGLARHACHGILWSIRDEMLMQDEFKDIAAEIMSLKPALTPKVEISGITDDTSALEQSVQFKGHLMISYQWGNQEVIKRISNELRSHGIPVWIDVDYMGGSTLQAMAQAVENSFAVIIAMSQKYKDSPNTRAEAEYTFQKRKPIIPLIMQQGYSPDGWLGLILGSKLYYDFSGKYSFESRMEGVLKAVFTIAGKGSDGPDGVEPLIATTAGALNLTSPTVLPSVGPSGAGTGHRIVPRHQVDEQRVRSWKRQDVEKWLTKHKLEGSPLEELSGEEVIFLHNLRYEAPEFFYNCLEKKLNLSSLLNLARATKAFEDLTLSPT